MLNKNITLNDWLLHTPPPLPFDKKPYYTKREVVVLFLRLGIYSETAITIPIATVQYCHLPTRLSRWRVNSDHNRNTPSMIKMQGTIPQVGTLIGTLEEPQGTCCTKYFTLNGDVG